MAALDLAIAAVIVTTFGMGLILGWHAHSSWKLWGRSAWRWLRAHYP